VSSRDRLGRACATDGGEGRVQSSRIKASWQVKQSLLSSAGGSLRGESPRMRRREFITLLEGAAAAWPLAAGAQQAKVFRLGHPEPGSPSDPIEANLRRQIGMWDLGHVEERHFKMEDRKADGHRDHLPALAAELAHLPVGCRWNRGPI
jgi:hypothetical protein